MAAPLQQRHISELHRLAAELGLERYRLLDRERLAAEILDRAPDLERSAETEEPPQAPPAERRPEAAPSPADDERHEGARRADRDEAPAEQVSGVFDLTPRGHGFIRLDGLEPGEGDVYVSPSQVRRCELEPGDEVAGPMRRPRRGERHPALVHVDTVNGGPPDAERRRFDALTATPPGRRIEVEGHASGEGDLLLRAIDLLCPLAFGQRVLVRAARRSGRTTVLRALAGAIGGREGVETIVLLIDERPEEVAGWREAAAGAELAIATADMRSGEQARLAELALARAMRRAEAGADVVLIVDSLSRLAVALDDPGRAKPIFGAGRETAEPEAGSLTVVATTLDEDGQPDGVFRALDTTETSLITLAPELAAAGVYPALEIERCRVVGEEGLRTEAELAGARALRAELGGLPPAEAASRLRELLGSSRGNAALLADLAG